MPSHSEFDDEKQKEKMLQEWLDQNQYTRYVTIIAHTLNVLISGMGFDNFNLLPGKAFWGTRLSSAGRMSALAGRPLPKTSSRGWTSSREWR